MTVDLAEELSAEAASKVIKMAELISLHLSPYLERNREVLQRRGCVDLRYDELVRQERHREQALEQRHGVENHAEDQRRRERTAQARAVAV